METGNTSLDLGKDFSLQEFVSCAICLDIAKEAVESSCCHNIFCQSCITSSKASKDECPTCREIAFQTNECYLARRLINIMPTVCPFNCGAKLTRGDLESHKKKCVNRVYSCARNGCEFKGAFESYTGHIIKAHAEDIVNAFDEAELKKRFCKKGQIEGYYLQNGVEHPIMGTFRMDNERFYMSTEDDVGIANWEGFIDSEMLIVKITKKYTGAHTVQYDGKINQELTEMKGKWSIEGYEGEGFKLILKK